MDEIINKLINTPNTESGKNSIQEYLSVKSSILLQASIDIIEGPITTTLLMQGATVLLESDLIPTVGIFLCIQSQNLSENIHNAFLQLALKFLFKVDDQIYSQNPREGK